MFNLVEMYGESVERPDSRSFLGDGMFAEAAENFDTLMKQMTVVQMQVQSYTESTESELNINKKRAEMKVFTESGTDEDLQYLEDAAEEGAVAKFKKLIEKLIEAWKNFVSTFKSKIMAKITSKEARTALSKAEKKVKMNPVLKRKRVKIIDKSKPLGVIKKYKDKADKACAKAAKGLLGEKEMKTFHDTAESYRAAFKNSIAGEAALITITVGALLEKLNSEIDKLPSLVDNIENEHTNILTRLQSTVSAEAAAAAQAATNTCANFRTEMAKNELNEHVDSIMNMINVLKSNVLKAKGNTEVDGSKKEFKESAESGTDDDALFESAFASLGIFDE